MKLVHCEIISEMQDGDMRAFVLRLEQGHDQTVGHTRVISLNVTIMII